MHSNTNKTKNTIGKPLTKHPRPNNHKNNPIDKRNIKKDDSKYQRKNSKRKPNHSRNTI